MMVGAAFTVAPTMIALRLLDILFEGHELPRALARG